MPQPTVQDVHVNRPLTNISTAYIQDANEFIASQVFPVVRVDKMSDVYYRYRKEDFFRGDAVTVRVDGRETSGTGYEVDTAPYLCRVYGVHKDIGPQLMANADQQINPDRDATLLVTRQLMTSREQLWTSTYFQAGVWGTDMAGAVAPAAGAGQFVFFDDFVNSNPRQVITDARLAMKQNTGMTSNTLVLGERVYETLLNHPSLIDLFRYTTGGLMTQNQLSQIFNIPRIIVGGAINATHVQGAAETYNWIQGDSMWLGYVAPQPSLLTPSAGYIFAWSGLLGANAYGGRIARIPTPLLGQGSYRVEGEMAYDMRVIGADLGTFFSGAIS